MSLDGFIEDRNGSFEWAAPDEEVHRFANDLERTAGIHLYGRRMYEVMAAWEIDPGLAAGTPYTHDFADIWQAAEKVVYSYTLESVSTSRTRLEREFDPDAVRKLIQTASQDVLIGGPELAAHAFRERLVDECHLFLVPVVVGGGKRALPEDIFLELDLLEERRFGNGMVYLRYRVKPGEGHAGFDVDFNIP